MNSWEIEKAKREEWLQSLKVGDEVLFPARRGGVGSIMVIGAETKAQWRAGGYNIRKKDGLVIGTSDSCYGTTSIKPVTDSDRLKIQKDREYNRMATLWNKGVRHLPIGSMQAISAILEAEQVQS